MLFLPDFITFRVRFYFPQFGHLPFSSSLEPHSVQNTALGLAGASGAVLTGAGFSVTFASDASGVVLTGAALTGAGFTGWAGLSAAGFAAGTVFSAAGFAG